MVGQHLQVLQLLPERVGEVADLEDAGPGPLELCVAEAAEVLLAPGHHHLLEVLLLGVEHRLVRVVAHGHRVQDQVLAANIGTRVQHWYKLYTRASNEGPHEVV